MDAVRCFRLCVLLAWSGGLGLRNLPAAPYSEASTPDVMAMEMVMSSSGIAVHEAPNSSDVFLRVSFTDGQAHGDVSFYDCVAMTVPDGGRRLQLTDFNGCPASMSPMGCMVEKDNLFVSPTFELSSLAEQGDVNITCSWESCTVPHHPKCANRCHFFTKQPVRSKVHRQSRDEHARNSVRHSISTKIRILPGHMRQRHQDGFSSASAGSHHRHHGMMSRMKQMTRTPVPKVPQHVHHQGKGRMMMTVYPSPLMYLNPIVCSLFLLILVVFLGFFVSFVTSLRRSVQHIKTEIERKRSCDKFLMPAACHD